MANGYPSQRPVRPAWTSLAANFKDPRECLAAFIALETAEVLQRIKPANLVTVNKRSGPCGRNLWRLWRQYGNEMATSAGLDFLELSNRHDSLLLLFYDAVSLTALLARRDVTVVLTKAGYGKPAEMATALAELQRRMRSGVFPHEIGVFLGYPLKDVIGFMGWAKLPFTCQGPWKIYGDPTDSLELAANCRECRCSMADRLANAIDPMLCLRYEKNTHRQGRDGPGDPS